MLVSVSLFLSAVVPVAEGEDSERGWQKAAGEAQGIDPYS